MRVTLCQCNEWRCSLKTVCFFIHCWLFQNTCRGEGVCSAVLREGASEEYRWPIVIHISSLVCFLNPHVIIM